MRIQEIRVGGSWEADYHHPAGNWGTPKMVYPPMSDSGGGNRQYIDGGVIKAYFVEQPLPGGNNPHREVLNVDHGNYRRLFLEAKYTHRDGSTTKPPRRPVDVNDGAGGGPFPNTP